MTLPILLKDLNAGQKIRVLAMDFVVTIAGEMEEEDLIPMMEQVAKFIETGDYETEDAEVVTLREVKKE